MISRIIRRGLFLPLVLIFGCCSEEGTSPDPFQKETCAIEAKYDYIRSVKGGGGIFIIRLVPGDDLKDPVELCLQANDCMHARLDRTALDVHSSVAEITVNPDSACQIKVYPIEIRASNSEFSQSIILEAEIMLWHQCYPEYALQVLNDFDEWLMKNHPEYADLSAQDWYCYDTYPQILVVSHWTLLSPEYEIRICHHNTIYPHNWTQFLLRKRGEFDAMLAVKRDNDSTALHEIPPSKYPTLFGY
ncbi:MAG TPA: hypothetical protein ENO22_06005 [candidate division Zixibacteria bacterium]|nr:hypothetical protein [candidate division Zixibacteria bacterium]HEQ98877.1 hypothetical protein [candidate division Zixibacteria bacterium]